MRNSAIVLFFSFVGASCSKNSDAVSTKADSVYMPVVIYNGATPLDSFVYNDDNTLATVFCQSVNSAYGTRMDFRYNISGQCKSVQYYTIANGKLEYTDSLLYGLNGTVALMRFYEVGVPDFTYKMQFNSNGALTTWVMDSLIVELAKTVDAYKLTFSNDNLTDFTHHYYYEYNGNVRTDFTDKYTFEYDTHANSLLEFFRKNPYMQVPMCWDQFDGLLITSSVNVLSKVSINFQGMDPESYVVHNTYDATTGLLTRQVLGDETNYLFDLNMRYRKVANK
ncbi:hypothetical protein FLA_3118 [Filimonas lacunae]|nr:hypothetical protein FLA_3118 [Filimonas lacunae]